MTPHLRGYSAILIILLAAFAAVLGIVAWQQGGLGSVTLPTVPTVSVYTPAPTDGTGGSIATYQSGVHGVVLLGPTCPVVQNLPQPQCADRPYQTLVTVYRASDPSHAFAQTQSTEVGEFEVSLPPGDYLVVAGESNVTLPRCAMQPFSVSSYGFEGVTVTCDTGIR